MSTKTFSVKKYTSAHKSEWDNFIDSAKNATFLFKRDFMEYHKDRFDDFSLMVYKNDELFAVLPANLSTDILYSHRGLTYGSLVLQPNAKLLDSFEAYKSLLQFVASQHIPRIEFKIIPSFYNTVPADELEYFLFLSNASLVKRDVIFLIDYGNRIKFQKNRREGINKAKRMGISVKMEDNFEGFWNEILISNLREKHNAAPVHSLKEIQMLADRFPENIKQFNAYKDEKIVAGTTVFLTGTTVHPQYVSGNRDKNSYGSLDLLYDFILEKYKDTKRYFDFNTSSEENGKILNEGLIFWKESCGARPIAVNNYSVNTNVWETLKLNLI